MSEPDLLINVFIPQVDAAGIAYFAIDHADLPVVAVVLGGRQEGLNAVCHLALDAITRDLFRIIIGQHGDGAHPIVHEPHFHPFPDLLL